MYVPQRNKLSLSPPVTYLEVDNFVSQFLGNGKIPSL